MRASKPLAITLPLKLAAKVKARVASGNYASESEVVRDGLRALEREEAVHKAELEHWLRTEGAKRVAAYEAGDMKLIPAAEAFARVKAQIGKRARNK